MAARLRQPETFAPKGLQTLKKPLATFLARMLQQRSTASLPCASRAAGRAMSLHTGSGGRKYLNAAERRRFQTAAQRMPPNIRVFCLVLMWTGCRISEALTITPLAIDLEARTVTLQSLKKRARGVVRQVPLPPSIVHDLNRVFHLRARQQDVDGCRRRLWNWSRSTGWRHVKRAMKIAGVSGSMAMPKALRHAFGVAAFEAVPPHLVQRWLGHASLRTTAIYGEVSGSEERAYAARVWRRW